MMCYSKIVRLRMQRPALQIFSSGLAKVLQSLFVLHSINNNQSNENSEEERINSDNNMM